DSSNTRAFAVVEAQRISMSGDLFQPASLFFKLSLLFTPRRIESAGLNELDDAAQLITIKPDAVLLAQVYDYPGTTSKFSPIHQLLTFRTGNITDFGLRDLR